MIIDFHTHAFPDRIVERAMDVLCANSGGIEPFTDGSVSGLRRYMRENGVDKAVLLNIATNPAKLRSINDFAAQTNSDDIIAFGSVHPFAPDAIDELCRIQSLGLKGIKLHPEYQNFYVDDPAVFPVYEKAAELGLITVFHAGLDIQYFEPTHCTPERLAKALPVFFGAPVVAAHMGGYMLWNDVERYLIGKDIYIDTAFSYSRMPILQAKRMVENHGYERFLFGSDLPWSGSRLEMRFIDHFGLDDLKKQAVLGGNAATLLGI